MDNYIEIANSNSRIIINDEYKNLLLLQSKRTPVSSHLSSFYYAEGDKNVAHGRFLKFSTTSVFKDLFFFGFTGVGDEIPVYTSEFTATVINPDKLKEIQFYCFSDWGINPYFTRKGTGIQIFNSKGETVFYSKEYYLRVIDYISFNKDEMNGIKLPLQRQYDVPIGVCVLSSFFSATGFYGNVTKRGDRTMLGLQWTSDRSFISTEQTIRGGEDKPGPYIHIPYNTNVPSFTQIYSTSFVALVCDLSGVPSSYTEESYASYL